MNLAPSRYLNEEIYRLAELRRKDPDSAFRLADLSAQQANTGKERPAQGSRGEKK